MLVCLGYDLDVLLVCFGYWYFKFNKEVGGVFKSWYIVGEVLDIIIDDINGDGSYIEVDKVIVFDFCEREIIGNWGGLGCYLGMCSIYIDVRGYWVCWD